MPRLGGSLTSRRIGLMKEHLSAFPALSAVRENEITREMKRLLLKKKRISV